MRTSSCFAAASRKKLQNNLRIGSVSDADRQLPAALRFRQRPVDHLAGDEIGVGNDDFSALECLDRAGADTDASDLSGVGVNFDDVVDMDGPLKLQNQARDEIVDNVLHSEADADAKRSGQHGELVELNAADVNGGQEDEHQQKVVDDRGYQLRQAPRHVEAAKDLFAEEEPCGAGNSITNDQDKKETKHTAQGGAAGSSRDLGN